MGIEVGGGSKRRKKRRLLPIHARGENPVARDRTRFALITNYQMRVACEQRRHPPPPPPTRHRRRRRRLIMTLYYRRTNCVHIRRIKRALLIHKSRDRETRAVV